jgi:hypothetical protein
MQGNSSKRRNPQIIWLLLFVYVNPTGFGTCGAVKLDDIIISRVRKFLSVIGLTVPLVYVRLLRIHFYP